MPGQRLVNQRRRVTVGSPASCSVQPQWSTSGWTKKIRRGNSWERRGSQRDGGGVAYTRTGAGWAVWADCQCTVILDQWCRGWRLTHSPPAGYPPKSRRWTINHYNDQLHAEHCKQPTLASDNRFSQAASRRKGSAEEEDTREMVILLPASLAAALGFAGALWHPFLMHMCSL